MWYEVKKMSKVSTIWGKKLTPILIGRASKDVNFLYNWLKSVQTLINYATFNKKVERSYFRTV